MKTAERIEAAMAAVRRASEAHGTALDEVNRALLRAHLDLAAARRALDAQQQRKEAA